MLIGRNLYTTGLVHGKGMLYYRVECLLCSLVGVYILLDRICYFMVSGVCNVLIGSSLHTTGQSMLYYGLRFMLCSLVGISILLGWPCCIMVSGVCYATFIMNRPILATHMPLCLI